jgi:hypothetical protein
LGSLPIVKENFEKAVFLIIGVSLLPMVYEYLKVKLESRGEKKEKVDAPTYKEMKESVKED